MGYNACGAIWRENLHFDEPEFLMVDVEYFDSRFGKQTKFVGGGDLPVDRGDSFVTTIREVLEETNLTVVADPDLIHSELHRDYPMYWYLIHFDDCHGVLRTGMLREKKSNVHPPRWVRASELEDAIHPTHRQALREALRRIRRTTASRR